jgi:hypothetical protein
MPKHTAPLPPVSTAVATVPKDYTAEHDKVVALIPTLRTEVEELTVADEGGYAYADSLLGRIDQQRKAWGAVWERLQERTIKPLRSALDGLYETNREIEKPLDQMREKVRDAMKGYKLAEAKRLAEADAAKRREEERLKREAEEATRKAQLAATPQMRGRLESQAAQKTAQAEIVAQREVAAPVIGVSSSTRTIPKLRIVDWAQFLQAALEDETVASVIPQEATEAALNKLWKVDKDVALWPGVQKYDDVQIVGR